MIDFVDQSNHHENRKRDDDEGQYCIKKNPVGNHRRIGGLGFLQSVIMSAREVDEAIGQVDVTGQDAERRHQDVFDERIHDFPKGSADDDTDGEVQNISTNRKCSKLSEKGVHLLDRDFDRFDDWFHKCWCRLERGRKRFAVPWLR